jgi:hypothetical protein
MNVVWVWSINLQSCISLYEVITFRTQHQKLWFMPKANDKLQSIKQSIENLSNNPLEILWTFGYIETMSNLFDTCCHLFSRNRVDSISNDENGGLKKKKKKAKKLYLTGFNVNQYFQLFYTLRFLFSTFIIFKTWNLNFIFLTEYKSFSCNTVLTKKLIFIFPSWHHISYYSHFTKVVVRHRMF